MAASPESVNIAMFCDFENVALGVRDTKFDKFDIRPVLERLLLKGSIVVKKAYCDWERYKGFKAAMHEANFELIEIPHLRQSGKNSADIRMVVDALDLCYTKSHVDTFVIVSGDSDFSPLVSKLRENAKHVIGVGIKQSTSDLLVANCDEFIFYDDLVRESQRSGARRDPKAAHVLPGLSHEEQEARKTEAVELAVATFEALVVERGESGKIWSSMLKEAMKRRKPDFHESHFGFRSFSNLLEEAQARGLLEIGRDEKSGAFVSRSAILPTAAEPVASPEEGQETETPGAAGEAAAIQAGRRSRSRGKRNGKDGRKAEAATAPGAEPDAGEISSSFRSFGNLLEEAQTRGLLEIGRDENPSAVASRGAVSPPAEASGTETPGAIEETTPRNPGKLGGKDDRKAKAAATGIEPVRAGESDPSGETQPAPPSPASRSRRPRKPKTAQPAEPAAKSAKA
ncbi:MAG: NYN domain-containing protein [Opitutaceae bacterium]|jgi:uncharacterized protein (TIGR00288 family)|nr:NYN domain-containing protein [Opitutaceae bacterium]